MASLLRRLWRPLERENQRWPRFRRLARAAYWIRTHTVDRYHLVDIRSRANGYRWGWIDRSDAVLFACFALLVQFVEREYPGHVDWDHTSESRAERDEFMALYRWWTVERPIAQKAGDDLAAKDDEMLARLVNVRGVLWT